MEGQISFMLSDPTVDKEFKVVATIDNGIKNGERLLSVILNQRYDSDLSIKEDDFEKVITFATLLYGGFDSKSQVYDQFKKEFDTKNTTFSPKISMSQGKQVEGPEVMGIWGAQVNDVPCRIGVWREDPANPKKQHLAQIQILSDIKTFFPNEQTP